MATAITAAKFARKSGSNSPLIGLQTTAKERRGMSELTYILRRYPVSAKGGMNLTKPEFDKIVAVRTVLTEVTSFEEKFYAISESYRVLEEFIFSTALGELLYN